ncbi:2-oxo acid dehydrogenase subunit E2 [Achromobacter aloeverae]|uniref:Dihydrolipoamide acetyltransferase component of pyruvate dehydrogenase complex n=1 Tax=Achromobacter aloeverae TaxID=1750518 RepID=A0A4Q1HLH8_9BURK|nr:2-oxo acid dehydrogenase subunit E2 [Achromobacter aloeverae]RXN91301.1 pyruvate dehydrogenase complex dihydrolipoamide acetyltransferase [Achromobacter aloeverae]
MPTLIRMPEISANAAAAQLVEWLVEEGAAVAAGDAVASIETDKAVVDLEAGAAGTLARRLARAGEQVAVGAAVAVVLTPGESADAMEAWLAQQAGGGNGHAVAPAATSAAVSVPLAPAMESTLAAPATTPVAPAPAPAPPPAPAPAPPPAPAPASHASTPSSQAPAPTPERFFASPLARKLARQAGIPLEALQGSGPAGRVIKRDIERAQAERDQAEQAGSVGRNAAAAAFETLPHSPMRATIARRLTESKQHIPHFYLRGTCRMEALFAMREQLNHREHGGHDEDSHAVRKFSVNDFIIKAAACALRDLPDTNVIWTETAMQRYRQVDIAVAVATPGGLITPVLHAVESMSLTQLSATMAELASRARASRLLPREYQGGTFAISNLGMYGVTEFAAIINPPQSAILAVGASNRVPVVDADGRLDTGVVMTYTLSVDHRAIDGALAAKWMGRFQQYMERPATMLV